MLRLGTFRWQIAGRFISMVIIILFYEISQFSVKYKNNLILIK